MFSNQDSSQFFPAYDSEANSYEVRGRGPSSLDNYSKPSALSGYDSLSLKENRLGAAAVMNR